METRNGTWRRAATTGLMLTTGILLAAAAAAEMGTSWLQSELMSALGRELGFQLDEGPSPSIRFPEDGPHDSRLGYVDLPRFVERLGQRGFTVEHQARLSPRHQTLIDYGGFPIYREKTQAGLSLLDRHGEVGFAARFPRRVYTSFEAVPPLVVRTLLFIENRELLDPARPRRNPAIEWDRMAAVLPGLAMQLHDPTIKVAGGSTLATQIEKYRHARSGQTKDATEKLRQMVSASLRAYVDGSDTTEVRRRIVVDYLNSTPLSARAGFGEVNGLGDGLWAWFGTDFARANQVLREPAETPEERTLKARLYRQVLSLLIAQRRPSHYLLAGRPDLDRQIERHVRLLVGAGIVDAELGAATRRVAPQFQADAPVPPQISHLEQKASNAIRTELLQLLRVPGLYPLDRLDLEVETSIDLPTQQRITDLLHQLREPELARELGLFGHRLLDADVPLDALIYSLTVYERGDGVNHLRVQTDNLDQPFDMNKGAKLDLGSTAKLRTLITYLEVFSRLHGQLTKTPIGERRQLAADGADPLTRWAAGQLAAHPEQDLRSFLEAAMARRYSASPHEFFYTGGGQHRFANFNRDDDARTMPVAQALRHSVNLVFIRMMRDIVRHYIAQPDDAAGELLRNRKNPGRSAYLARFADREGSAFLHRFHREFAGLDPDQVLRKLADRMRPRASRLAVAFRTVRPDADRPAFAAFLRDRLSGKRLPAATIERLYRNYAPEKFSLADRGYLARVHPLKLWLAGFLQTHPAASRREILTASTAERQASYIWLFRTRHKRAQDRRIRVLLEEDAFERIHEAWQRLGYPFDSMVPSYASALGSSADRPEALAELIGIILNDGVLQPTARIERLHFAADTPYETILGARPAPSKRILAPEIAQVVRAAMIDVVEAGTARRLRGAFLNDDGTAIPIGAKTGTGDNRRKYFDRRGRLIRSEVVSRTATVVFFIGDQLFGNMTIYVPGKAAAGYRFTSSLPAQLLKALAPALQPLLDGSSPQTVEVAPVSGA